MGAGRLGKTSEVEESRQERQGESEERWCGVGGGEKSSIVLFLKNNPLPPPLCTFLSPKLAALPSPLRGCPFWMGEVVLDELNSYIDGVTSLHFAFVSVLGCSWGTLSLSVTAGTLKMYKMLANRATSRTFCSAFWV